MNDPATPRTPPPNWWPYAAGVLVVVGSLTSSRRELALYVLCWTTFVGVGIWRSPYAQATLRRALSRLTTPAAVVTLLTRWSNQDIEAWEVATPAEIAAFERENGVALPTDLRRYFAVINGTRSGRDDRYGVGFWHLKRVSSFADTHVSADPDAARTFAFADWSWEVVYGVRLSEDAREETPVFASLPSGRVQVAASFSEFVEGYLANPGSVLFPDFDVIAVEEGIATEYNGVVTCSIRWQDINAISITLIRGDDQTVRAMWVIDGDGPVSPLHSLFAPVVLSARASQLTERLRALAGFDEVAFRTALSAEHRDEPGTFVCWQHPDRLHEPPAVAQT